MKRSTLRTPINAVRNAEPSNRSHFSIGRTPQRHGAGLGIATVSNAGALIAPPMGQLTGIDEMLGSRLGELATQGRRLTTISVPDSKRSMASRSRMLRQCGRSRRANARSVNDQRNACSSITATSKDTFAPCFVRPATRSLAGMRKRPMRSCGFKPTSLATQNSCHADVLLELANGKSKTV